MTRLAHHFPVASFNRIFSTKVCPFKFFTPMGFIYLAKDWFAVKFINRIVNSPVGRISTFPAWVFVARITSFVINIFTLIRTIFFSVKSFIRNINRFSTKTTLLSGFWFNFLFVTTSNRTVCFIFPGSTPRSLAGVVVKFFSAGFTYFSKYLHISWNNTL